MKTAALREMSVNELEERLRDTQRELFDLRRQQVGGHLEKPSRIRELRREIARMKTVMHERGRED